MVCYPTQMMNQRMEYWQQDKFKESCGFCPHINPNTQDTYQYQAEAGNSGRSPFLNVGASYDVYFDKTSWMALPQQIRKVLLILKLIMNLDYVMLVIHMKMNVHFCPTPLVRCTSNLGACDSWATWILFSKTVSKTMNSVTSINLECNFNNLRNMVLSNKNKLLDPFYMIEFPIINIEILNWVVVTGLILLK